MSLFKSDKIVFSAHPAHTPVLPDFASAPTFVSAFRSQGTRLNSRSPETELIIRRVMLSQLLFMAGNSLTVGGIFNYFVSQFHPSSFLLAAAMIAPETSQSLSVLARQISLRFPNRKRNWIVCLCVGRVFGMLLPLALLWPARDEQMFEPLLVILLCTCGWYVFQGISYVNYISWLSDLVPEVHWGKLFSRRQIAGLSVSLGMPIVMLMLRRHFLKGLPPEAERWSYSLLLIGGGLITLTSIVPLLRFQDRPEPSQARREQMERGAAVIKRRLTLSRSFRFLLASRWWLAFFQGLTQAVIFKYSAGTLKISVETYTVLSGLMILLQMPLAFAGGKLSDAFQERRGMFWSMVFVSFAMLFWVMAKPETWYLAGCAYLLWGGFGMLNVCSQSLCLKLAPDSDNQGHLALYDQVSGLIAGLAGLLGGLWLDRLLASAEFLQPLHLTPFALIFLVSWAGRMTAALWLLPVKQPQAPSSVLQTDRLKVTEPSND